MKFTLQNAFLLLLLYAVLAGAWAWRFMEPPAPISEELQARQAMQEKLAAWLAVAPRDTALPALMSLVKMPDEEIQILADWLKLSPISQARELTVQQAPITRLGPEWNAALLQTWLIHAPPVDLLEVHLMIAAADGRLTDAQKHDALEELAHRAQSQGDLADAVTILGRTSELPTATWDTLKHLVMAARTARNTPPALLALSLWIKRHTDDAADAILKEAKDLEFTLMLEADRADEALSQQLAELTGGAHDFEHVLDRAWVAARQTHQSFRLLPHLEKYLQSFPEHSLSEQKLSLQTDLSPIYLRWLICYASICDEEQPKTVAFAAFQRLARARVPLALPRLCALATTPTLVTELEKILAAALNQPELQRTVLQLAQSNDQARKVLSERLRQAPRERDLHYAATLAAAQAQKEASTAVLWQDFLRRFPHDSSAHRRLIQAHLQDHQPAMALRAYGELPEADLTHEDRQQIEMIRQL